VDAQLYATLDKAWKSTCRVLFGQEIGELKRYEEWLAGQAPILSKRKSYVSGKEVILAKNGYAKNARFISAEEVAQNKSYALSINDIKDIDSISAALAEKCEYAGNRFLGNSSNVEHADIVMNSHFVNSSTNIEESMYVDSSFMVRRNSKYIFGAGYCGQSEFLVRVVGTFNSKRCFESYFIPDSSDLYFCDSCFGSHDLLFCFGQRSTSYRIGNLQLPKEKYLGLKQKILAEVVQELQKEGRFPTLLEIAGSSKEAATGLEIEEDDIPTNMAPIEKGFAFTYKLLFKKEPLGIEQYEKWLSKNAMELVPEKTVLGGTVYCPRNIPYFSKVPKGRMASFSQMLAIGKKSLSQEEVQTLSSIKKHIGKISYFTPELYDGENANYIASPLVYHGTNVYKTYDITYGDNAGVCLLALNSKYVYGCYRVLESQFSFKCYNSLYLNRCLELDSCNKCSDSYFCHNCEGLVDCMFCFNMKGKRFAIGNTDLQREKYAQIKEMLLKQMGEELEKKKELKWDIYSIGAMQ